MPQFASIILAAGQGTRMKSKYPKVIHPLLGQPMLQYVVNTARNCGASPIMIVVGFEGEQVIETLGAEHQYIWQKQQLGTGHAVMMAGDILKELNGDLLVLYGDTPLLPEHTIHELVDLKRQHQAVAAILTTEMANPAGYGRIIRGETQDILGIVEDKDASLGQKAIREVNTGVYCFDISILLEALTQISPRNAQGEYYLTDVFKIFVERGLNVVGLLTEAAEEVMGPNDRVQFAQTESYLRQQINERWMREGVTMVDPAVTYIGPEVEIGRDTVILPGTMIFGKTGIGEDCTIGPHTRITDCLIETGSVVQYSQLTQAHIGPDNQIGPFAFVRPGTVTSAKVKIGDFVELKNTTIGIGSKVPHLTYMGDAEVGSAVNIGAGTITCNYDGVHKHRTIIGDKAFIGSNANLVAPVKVGAGATVAAGSTITKEVPDGSLGVARSRQENKLDWRPTHERPKKE